MPRTPSVPGSPIGRTISCPCTCSLSKPLRSPGRQEKDSASCLSMHLTWQWFCVGGNQCTCLCLLCRCQQPTDGTVCTSTRTAHGPRHFQLRVPVEVVFKHVGFCSVIFKMVHCAILSLLLKYQQYPEKNRRMFLLPTRFPK